METLLAIGLIFSLMLNGYIIHRLSKLNDKLNALSSVVSAINVRSFSDGRHVHKLMVCQRDTMDCLVDTMKLVMEMYKRLF